MVNIEVKVKTDLFVWFVHTEFTDVDIVFPAEETGHLSLRAFTQSH